MAKTVHTQTVLSEHKLNVIFSYRLFNVIDIKVKHLQSQCTALKTHDIASCCGTCIHGS